MTRLPRGLLKNTLIFNKCLYTRGEPHGYRLDTIVQRTSLLDYSIVHSLLVLRAVHQPVASNSALTPVDLQKSFLLR